MNDYPKTFLAKIFKTMSEPEIPDPPKDAKGNITDSTFQFRYYKYHYWENVDFGDERLLRTPIFQNKIKTYMNQLTAQTPDSIIVSADTIIEKLTAAGGHLPFHDNSLPEEIRDAFGISKKAFKQGIGSLFRERRIFIDPDGIRLMAVTNPKN